MAADEDEEIDALFASDSDDDDFDPTAPAKEQAERPAAESEPDDSDDQPAPAPRKALETAATCAHSAHLLAIETRHQATLQPALCYIDGPLMSRASAVNLDLRHTSWRIIDASGGSKRSRRSRATWATAAATTAPSCARRRRRWSSGRRWTSARPSCPAPPRSPSGSYGCAARLTVCLPRRVRTVGSGVHGSGLG